MNYIPLLLLCFLSLSTAQNCQDGFHQFASDQGDICIPDKPERIVVLDQGTMTDLLALGVQPSAVNDWGRRDFAQYLNVDTETIASAGTPDGPNYEVMLNLDTDLIIGRANNIQWFGDNALENLEAIAPTALSSVEDTHRWDEHLRFVAALVGKETEADALISSYEARLQEFREAYEAKGEDATIAIIRSRPDSFNIYANEYFISETVKAAGLKMPEGYADFPGRYAISIEEIDVLNSDYLFVMVRNEREAAAFLDARESPLWQFLPAVQQNQDYQVNWSVWVAGWNVIGAHLVIDDLFYYLLDGAESVHAKPEAIQALITEGYGPEYDVARFSGN